MSDLSKQDKLRARWKTIKYDIDRIMKTFDKPDGFYNHKTAYDYQKRYEKLHRRLIDLNNESKEFLKEMEG